MVSDLKNSCKFCPRDCKQNSFCSTDNEWKLAIASKHWGEEPPISGVGGSGTLFFSGCNLRCPFCQNYQISRGLEGTKLDDHELIKIFKQLQKSGAENLNFVTATHFSAKIVNIINRARAEGVTLPVVWNSSGYESVELIEEISSVVDIWLPDLKTVSSVVAKDIYMTSDYVDIALPAIKKMVEMNPLQVDMDGNIIGGVIVRHLVLPGYSDSSSELLEWFSSNLKGKAYLSLMSQFTPVESVGSNWPQKLEKRILTQSEYDSVLCTLEKEGIDEGFFQGFDPGSEWLPDFTKKNPFSSELSKIIWKDGSFV